MEATVAAPLSAPVARLGPLCFPWPSLPDSTALTRLRDSLHGPACLPSARPCAAELVVARVRKLRLGDGLEPGVTLGPLINAAALDKVAQHVADALAKGAQVGRAVC